MLGLVQQVGGQQPGVGAVVGDDQALARSQQHGRDRAVALHLDLGAGHRRAAGADDLADPRHGLGAEGQGRDAGRAVGPEHLGHAQLLGHDQHGRVDLAVGAGHGRHDHRDLRHPGHDGGRGQLDQDRRVGGLAAGHEQPGAGDGGHLLAHGQAGLGLEAPVAPGRDLLVEPADVVDAVADRAEQGGAHRGPGGGELLLGDPQPGRVDRAAVERLQRPDQRRVAVLAHVLDQGGDVPAQAGVEDLVQAAGDGALALVRAELVPAADQPDRAIGVWGVPRMRACAVSGMVISLLVRLAGGRGRRPGSARAGPRAGRPSAGPSRC